MELVYAFCLSYVNIKNIEVNFNPQYIFRYDKNENKLTFEWIKEQINIFSLKNSNTIVNVNAIIGENGSGKTTFINFLLESYSNIMTSSRSNISIPYILIFSKVNVENGLKEFYIYNNKIKISPPINNEEFVFKVQNNVECKETYLCLIYYTNAFSFSEYKKSGYSFLRNNNNKLYDMSLISRLRNVYNDDSSGNEQIIRAYHKMVEDQIVALETSDLPFDKPELHIIFDSDTENALENIFHEAPMYIVEKKSMIIEVCSDLFCWNADSRKQRVLRGIVYSLIKWMINDNNHKNEEKLIMMTKVSKYWGGLLASNKIRTENLDADSIYTLVTETFACMDEKGEAYNEIISAYKTLIDFLLNDSFILERPEIGGFVIENDNKEKISSFYNCYLKAILTINGFLSFEWNLSTGEFARFDLYAQLFKLGNMANANDFNKKIKADSFLLIIDEADLYIHPKWQQEFVCNLLSDLNKLFKNKKVQIILATHSPIVLSDIPRKHVIYFPENKNTKETFAANIYNLYNDSFFLEENMIMLGKFSNDVITEIYKQWREYVLKGDELSIEQVDEVNKQKKVVDMIAEPLIQNMLNDWYVCLKKT